MKTILLTSVYIFFHFASAAQFSVRENEAIKIEQSQDTLPRTIFLDSTDLPNLKLNFARNSRQVWSSIGRDTKEIEQFFDIRIKFESREKALAFHKEYWKENSEYGPEIRKHKVDTQGTEDFRAFKAADLLNEMSAEYGLQMYCYIFVVDNYFVKFFISCKKELAPNVIQPYVNSVVEKIKK